MVDVAQLVRAPVCGTGGRGFKSRHPPQFFIPLPQEGVFICPFIDIKTEIYYSSLSKRNLYEEIFSY